MKNSKINKEDIKTIKERLGKIKAKKAQLDKEQKELAKSLLMKKEEIDEFSKEEAQERTKLIFDLNDKYTPEEAGEILRDLGI